MSTSTPRAPARVITNPSLSLSSRSPSLPSFTPYLTHALQQKQLKYILPRTALLSWAVCAGTAVWMGGDGWLGTVLMPFGWKVLLASVLVWVGGVVPVLVGRKRGLGEPRPKGTSPLAILSSSWTQHKPKSTLLICTLSALTMVLAHIFLSYAFESTDPRLSVFVKSKKHPYYLSPRTLYLLLTLVPLITLQTTRTILLRAPFPSGPPSILSVPVTACALALLTIPLTALIFLLLRLIAFPILAHIPLLNPLLKPVIGHLLRPRSSLFLLPFTHIGLIIRSTILSFLISLTQLTTTHILDAALSQRILTGAPLPALIQGTDPKESRDGNIFTMYFAYTELMHRLQFPGVAEEIFTDTKFQPGLWSTLLRNSLIFLGERYQETLRRGVPPPPPPLPQKVEVVKKEVEVGTPPEVLRKRVFKNASASSTPAREVEKVLDVFSSEGPASHIPELFRSVSAPPTPSVPVPAPAAAAVEAVKKPGFVKALTSKLVSRAAEKLPEDIKVRFGKVKRWAEMERVGRSVEVGVRGWEGVRGVVEVISFLTAASLERDAYGTVQRDIPKILEAYTRFLAEIEGWTIELNRARSEGPDDGERERGVEVLGEIGDAFKEGTALIVRTFGDKLLAFKFPTAVAGRVQGFLDYCAV